MKEKLRKTSKKSFKKKSSSPKKRLSSSGTIASKRKESPETTEAESRRRYWEGIGRRKTSVARVRLFTKGDKDVLVNNRPYQRYFPLLELQRTVIDPLVRMRNLEKFRVEVHVQGGGIRGQAEAIRHGVARALVKFNEDFKKRLRRAGFLTRDPRMKERKKFGLKSARRAPQWKKR